MMAMVAKKTGLLAMLAKTFNAENAGASGERIFFGYNVPHPHPYLIQWQCHKIVGGNRNFAGVTMRNKPLD